MNRYYLAGILIILIITAMIGCVGSNKSRTELTGTIFISGNEPFTYLALKGEDDNYYKLLCEENVKKELWSLQGQKVSLEYSDLKKSDRESIVTVKKIITTD